MTFQQFEVAAIIALSAYTAAFIAEAVRSGVNSVPVGQAEAARSIGMKFGQVLTLIILPQALRTVIPPLINILIALVKNSSVAGAFFVLELFGYGRQLANANGDQVCAVLARRRLLLPADHRSAGHPRQHRWNERWRLPDELQSSTTSPAPRPAGSR